MLELTAGNCNKHTASTGISRQYSATQRQRERDGWGWRPSTHTTCVLEVGPQGGSKEVPWAKAIKGWSTVGTSKALPSCAAF